MYCGDNPDADECRCVRLTDNTKLVSPVIPRVLGSNVMHLGAKLDLRKEPEVAVHPQGLCPSITAPVRHFEKV